MENVMSILNEGLVYLMNQNEELSKLNPTLTEEGGIEMDECYYICVEEENNEMILSLYADNPISFKYWGCDKLNPNQIVECILFFKDKFDNLDNNLEDELITNFR
jgi:hypothetical protein